MYFARIATVLMGFSIIAAPLAATVVDGSDPSGETVGSNTALSLDGRGWVSLPTEVTERLRTFSGPVTIEICMRWREFRKWSRAWDFGSDTGALFLGNAGVESTLVTCCTGIQNDNVFAGSLPLDHWVTIAAAWDAQVFRLYLDGKQIHTQAAKPAAFPASGTSYFLGNSNWRADELLCGDIDAFSIKRGALYAADYEPTLLAPDSRSLLFYGFENTDDAVVVDSSCNGNHGLLKGAWRFIPGPEKTGGLETTNAGRGGAPAGDVWGPAGRASLQAGIRVVDWGTALEVVLRNANSGVCEMESKQLWVFHFRDRQGVEQHFQPDRLPGMEGRIVLREGETRRGKIRVGDISPGVDVTKEWEVWVTWGSERPGASGKMSIRSGVVTVKEERNEEAWQREERERMWSSLSQQTPEGRREIRYGKLGSSEFRLVIEKPEAELANATWGMPEGGVRAGIVLDKKSVRASDGLAVELVLENVGGADVAWLRAGSFASDWTVNVTQPNGKKAQMTESYKQMFMVVFRGRDDPVLFRAGELARVRISIADLFVLSAPGEYELSAAHPGFFAGRGGEKSKTVLRSSVKFILQE